MCKKHILGTQVTPPPHWEDYPAVAHTVSFLVLSRGETKDHSIFLSPETLDSSVFKAQGMVHDNTGPSSLAWPKSSLGESGPAYLETLHGNESRGI